MQLCKNNCCPVYNPETGLVEENGVQILPEYIIEEWEHKAPGETEITVAGLRFTEEMVDTLKKILRYR